VATKSLHLLLESNHRANYVIQILKNLFFLLFFSALGRTLSDANFFILFKVCDAYMLFPKQPLIGEIINIK